MWVRLPPPALMNSNMDEYLKEAFPLCLTIPRQKKHVSFILYKSRIISVGMNCFKTHPGAKKIGYMYDEMHSEFDAFRKVPRSLRGKKLHLLNVRFNKFGDMRMSRPCCLCEQWCKEIFSTIHYTTNEGVVQLDY